MTEQLKVLTVVGTRPEIIRLTMLIQRLDREVDHTLVHTGQNSHYLLNQVFFEDLGLRFPDIFLEIDSSSPALAMAGVLSGIDPVLESVKPDAVMILGDTNSSIAAVAAERRGIPVYHMEAGNRSFDKNVPEELNRRLVDHVATFNLPYNSHSYRNLLAEGIHPRFMVQTGSPIPELWEALRDRVMESDVLERMGLVEGTYFLASLHRQENVDNYDRLNRAIQCLNWVANEWDAPVVLSTHPRTRLKIEQHGITSEKVLFHEPFGYLDYNKLQLKAKCVISDSGTISEESSIMGFKAVTLRDSMERPEAFDAGTLTMSGLDPRNLSMCINHSLAISTNQVPDGYSFPDFSSRVFGFMLSTVGQASQWLGRRK